MFASNVARSLVEQLKDQVQVKVERGDSSKDKALGKTLEGLRLASVHAADAILSQLLEWRSNALDTLASGRVSSNHGVVMRSQLIIEVFFMGAARNVVANTLINDRIVVPMEILLELQELAFDWILNADRYVDLSRYQYEQGRVLTPLRDKVVLSASQLLGELSFTTLESIKERFLVEFGQRIKVDASSPSRQEAYDLCHALRFVKLRGTTPSSLKSSIKFLDSLFPLKHVALEKKSGPQQALCDLLTNVLSPLVDLGDPGAFGLSSGEPSLRAEWLSTVKHIRVELSRWIAKQSKQALAGYPVITALTCIEDESALVSNIDGLIDNLNRQLKDKKTCSMGLLCLTRSISCFLRRLSGRSDPERLATWVARATQVAVSLAIKGAFTTPEQIIVMKNLCVSVAAIVPAYAVQGILLELMTLESGHCWEAPYIAVSSLVPILAKAHGRLLDDESDPSHYESLPPTPAALEALVKSYGLNHQFGKPVPAESLQQMENLMQQNYSLMDVLGIDDLEEDLSNGLDRVRAQCHQLHGYNRGSTARYQGDWIKERISALAVLVSIVDCLPFIIPSGWKVESKASEAFMEDLPGYTLHAEPCLRSAAVSALLRCMSAWPESRDCIIQGMSHVIKGLMQQDAELLIDSSKLLLKLLHIWEVSLGQRGLSEGNMFWSASAGSSFDSIHSVESCGFYMLCHDNVEIRDLGLKILESSCQLLLTVRELAYTGDQSLNSTTSKVPSSLGSKTSDLDHVVDQTLRAQGQPRTLQQSSSMGQGSQRNDESIDKFRQSFSEMMSPRGSPFPATLPWQKAISATVRVEPASSAPTSPTSNRQVEQRCLIEIIYAYGDQIARKSIWNYGIYSKIFRTWKPVPEHCTFQSSLYGNKDPNRSRVWLRMVSEIMRYCWIYAKDTALQIVAEAFEGMGKLLLHDQQGRKYLATDGTKGRWSNLYAFAVAPTPSWGILKGDNLNNRFGLFVSIVINTIWMGSEEALGALEFVDESFQASVVEKSQMLRAEYSQPTIEKKIGIFDGSKSISSGKKDCRLAHAQVLAAVCSNLAPSSLSSQVEMRESLVSFLIDMVRFLDMSGDISSEIQQMRYCLCIISRELSLQLSTNQTQVFPPMLRKQLYGKFGIYTEEGQTQGLFRSELRRQIAAAKAAVKPRDPGRIQQVERQIINSSEMLEHAANLAMSSMLMGSIFDTDTKHSEGKVLTWIRRMLECSNKDYHHLDWAPQKDEIAKEALKFLLSSNLELVDLFVDQCYSVQMSVSNAYFVVLADIIMQNQAVKLDPQTMIALVLTKMVDPDSQVRSKAGKLLHTIERRYKPDESADSATGRFGLPDELNEGDLLVQDLVVVGGLQNSNSIFQQKVSSAMAVHYEKISLSVVLELLKRQLQSHPIPERVQLTLACLPPWLENADFCSNLWLDPALDLLFQVSNIDGLIQTITVQEIWETVASQRGNINPVLDFLIDKLVSESIQAGSNVSGKLSMESGKHVALYLSRVGPKHTIGHLIAVAESEVTHAMNSFDSLDKVPTNSAVELGLIKEWHHRAAQAPSQQPLPLQQPIAARAAAAMAAETASSSQPFTPSSFAQAIKKSTLDIILKTGVAVADTVAVAGAAAVGTISASGLVDLIDEESKSRRVKYGEYDNDDSQDIGLSRVDNLLRHSSLSKGALPNDGEEQPIPKLSGYRTALSPQEGAVCLLSEIVSENDEYLRPHLARLLHVSVLQLDSCNALVCHEACQLLQFLLYNLSYKILENNSKENSKAVYSSDYARVAGVIGYLQGLPSGERIWEWELPTLSHPWIGSAGSLAAFVQIVADCFPFDTGLSTRWSSEALKWACCSATRHGASRSHQIYCSLSPCLTSQACTALVSCLEKCLRTASSDGLDMAVEILCTLRVLLSNTQREKVILYPQLFAACVALLNSTVVRVGELAIAMLVEILDCLDFSNPNVQDVILSVFSPNQIAKDAHLHPSNDQKWIVGQSLLEGKNLESIDQVTGPFMALQQLLVKGLFQNDTESLTLKAFGSLCRQVAHGTQEPSFCLMKEHASQLKTLPFCIESIIGDKGIGLAITIASSLPWILVQVNLKEFSEIVSGFLKDASRACRALGWHDIGAMLKCMEADSNSKISDIDTSLRYWSKEAMPIIINQLFPGYGLLFIQRIVETVQRASSVYQRAALYILEAIFSDPQVDIGNDEQILNETCLVEMLALELNGELGSCVVRVMRALSRYQKSMSPSGTPPLSDRVVYYSWKNSIDEIGECNKICANALAQIALSCPLGSELLVGGGGEHDHLLPFLDG
jgi:hypothetical protein